MFPSLPRVNPGPKGANAGPLAPGAADAPPPFEPRPVAEAGVIKAVWSAATAFGRAWVTESWRNVSPGVWRSALNDAACDHRFFEVIERAMRRQFEQRYFVLENRHEGRFAVQPFFLVRQDLAAGLPARARRLFEPWRRRWPHLLTARVLMVGNPAGEGRVDGNQPWVPRALYDALTAFSRHAGVALMLLKDFPAEYRPSFRAFTERGFVRMPGLPSARLPLDFIRFDDFVAQRLSKSYRKSLRRKWRAISRQPPVTMALVDDLRAVIDDIFPLHLQVYARAERRFEALTPEYLLGLQERLPDKVRCFVWRQRGKVVAFNLCLVHGQTLYDLDVGFDYEVALDLHLYFLTWRDVVEWCLRHGIRIYEGGPLNYDPKLHLGFELVPQDVYLRHAWRPLGPLLRLAARWLGPVPHEPLLKRFSNYSALFGQTEGRSQEGSR